MNILGHTKRLVIDVVTNEPITIRQFETRVMEAALEAEITLNETTRLRWHIKDEELPRCTCLFVAIGQPMKHNGCKVHKHKQYACGFFDTCRNTGCICKDYRPSAKPAVDDGLHWPLCICGHSAQEH